MKRTWFFTVLAGLTALAIVLGACGNSINGGGGDDPLIYSGTAGGKDYTLTITKAPGRQVFRPEKGDLYELKIDIKISTGTVAEFNNGAFTLQPSVEGAETFTATVSVSGGSLEGLSGSIIFDGETEAVTITVTLDPPKKTIGVVFREGERWQQEMFTQAIEAKGYTAQVKVSPDNNQSAQNSLIRELLNNGAKAILVYWAFGEEIETVMEEAEAKAVPIIAIGWPILDIDSNVYNHNVDVDNYKVGKMQGTAIEDKLKLKTAAGSFNIALFAGSATDNNALKFYDGAISVLSQYISTNKLKVVGPYPADSDDANFGDITIENWDRATAKTKMAALLAGDAASLTLNAVLAPNDGTAAAMIEALEADAKYAGKTISNGFPIITGQDNVQEAVELIHAGKLYMTIEKTRPAADAAVELVDKLIKGESNPTVTGTTVEIKNNGAKDIKTYLANPVVITRDNL